MKRSLVLCAFLVITGLPTLSQTTPCAVTIHVEGFRNQKGDLGMTVFKSADGWPEDNTKALQHGGYPFSGDKASVKLDLPAGRYAFAVIHDENSNHKLDRNFVGFPKEGFGFSNNPKVYLTAPGFSAAAAEVTCPATDITIHLIYK